MPQSLQCPRCNGSVRVPDKAAGRRVKCPHCQGTFLAPGIDRTKRDNEEDWLSLDEPTSTVEPKTSRERRTQPPIQLSPEQNILGDDSLAGSFSEPPNLPSDSSEKAAKQAEKTDTDHDSPSGMDTDLFSEIDGEATDEEFVLKLPEKSTPKSSPKTGNPTSLDSGFLENEEALLREFAADEFDDFTSDSEPLPSVTRSNQAKGIAGQPGSTGKTPAKSQPTKEAQPVEFASEYRVTCTVCGTYTYAKANQAGKTTKCGDCFSDILIPSPPKIEKKKIMDLDQVETFRFESSPNTERRPDPFQKSADQLLEEAERAEDEDTTKPNHFETPKVGEWVASVLGPFRDPSVLVHLAGLCILAIVPTLIVLKMDMAILTLGLFPGGLVFGLLTVSCAMAVLLAASNNEARVSEWPTFDPEAWFEQLIVVGSAAFIVAVPCWLLCTLILGPHLLSAALTMFCIFLLFPFVLLSMLDMGSVFSPFSSELARSVTKCEEAWGGFYFSSAVLFIGTFLIFLMGSGLSNEACAIVSIIAAVTATFVYFGMIGRLAYAIGQAINAPPRTDEVERTKREPME